MLCSFVAKWVMSNFVHYMVKIEGHCVLLQISLRIKMFDFFDKAKITVWITSFKAYFCIPEKNVKRLETRPQSSKNAQKWIQNCKIHDVDKSTLWFGFQ